MDKSNLHQNDHSFGKQSLKVSHTERNPQIE